MGEQKRGCGWRKIGGLYLVADGFSRPCDFLPYELTVCRHCGAGVKQGRGFQWLARSFFGRMGCKETCRPTGAFALSRTAARLEFPCPMDEPPDTRFGLLWVGARFYPTPADFAAEAAAMGISKRIAQVPKDLILGETWVFLAHPRCLFWKAVDGAPYGAETVRSAPGIFYMFRPTAIEKILTGEMATSAERQALERRGITPVIVHDRERHRTGDDDADCYPLPFEEGPAADSPGDRQEGEPCG